MAAVDPPLRPIFFICFCLIEFVFNNINKYTIILYWLFNIFDGFQRAARVIKKIAMVMVFLLPLACCIGSWVLSSNSFDVLFLKMKLQKDGILN